MTNDTRQIAEPFSNIFTEWAEAEWAFDLLREAIRRLRVRDPYDARVAVTLPQRSERHSLHLNFGGWLVLGFNGPGQQSERVDIALLANSVTWDERFSSFSFECKEGEPEVRGYQLPLNALHPMTTDLERAFFTTLDFIADKFQSWKKSTRWKHHNPEIIEACFDLEKRALLLAGGLDDVELRYDRHFTAFHYEFAEEGEEYVVERDGGVVTRGREEVTMQGDKETMPEQDQNTSYFSVKTFELLEGLHNNPTKDFYTSHKADFKLYLEESFKELFHQIAALLLPQITEMMETEKRLFSRIPKNDFGQGGAWDFYWAAFYPKGGKRTSDAQLSMVINYQHLELGFSIGELNNKARQQFSRNCADGYQELLQLLPPVFVGEKVLFGRHNEIIIGSDGRPESKNVIRSWQEWLQEPSVADFDAAVVFSKQDILRLSRDELLRKISDTYTRFFPLVLLATLDDPLPAIREYLAEISNKLPITDYQSPNPPISNLQPSLLLSTIAEQTGLDETDLARWVRAIERKGQAVLYGPPGTGKTFIVEKLAAHLVGGGDGFVDLVQFHPAYAYEDFIQGIRPQSDGGQLNYPIVPGRFLEFCRKAEQRTGHCVLIIDEINRANLSRVFGELMYLLEYRNQAIPLAGGGQLKIPQNVRLVGTMNTADRSIALVDHALRRRFAFIALEPNFNVLRHFHEQAQSNFPVDTLVALLTRLNAEIGDPHYAVGITFFLYKNLAVEIADVWQMEIEPYLQEYFFDQPDKVDTFRWQAIKQELDL